MIKETDGKYTVYNEDGKALSIAYGSEKEAEGQIAMAKLILSNAVNSISENGKEAIIYFAEGDEQRMMLMGLKRFTKYTNHPNVIALRKIIAEKVIEENKYCF